MTKLYAYLAGLGALLLSILAALGMAKRAGVKQEQERETEKSLEDAKKGAEIDSKVNQSSDADVAAGLSKFTRDK